MRWTFLDLIFLTLGLGTISEAFSITKYGPNSESFVKNEGEDLELSCTADNEWKFCYFTNVNTSNFVRYDYNSFKSQDGSYVQKTDSKNLDPKRMHYTSDPKEYYTKRCSIRLEKLEKNDAGLWECKLEEWNSDGQQENTGARDTKKWKISVVPDFKIVNNSVDIVKGKEDETVGLYVTVNYNLKSCIVKKGGEEKCQFTWSESSGEINELNNCDQNGNKNDKRTCAIELKKLKADDEGEWSFELDTFSKNETLTKVITIEVLPKFKIDSTTSKPKNKPSVDSTTISKSKPKPKPKNKPSEGEKQRTSTITIIVVVVVAILIIGIVIFVFLRYQKNKKQSINEDVSLRNVDKEKKSSETNANEGYEKEVA